MFTKLTKAFFINFFLPDVKNPAKIIEKPKRKFFASRINIIRKYSDIKGVCYNTTHFIIEMKQEYVIYLPLSIDAKFRILTKQKTYYS